MVVFAQVPFAPMAAAQDASAAPAASDALTDAQPIERAAAALKDGMPADVRAIPALTPVSIVIDADLGSKISTTGQTFPIHLAETIVIDGHELAPAGAVGEGEVIHAKKAGGSGAPGELVLTARFLTVNGRPLKLRSMRVGLVGGDAVNGVVAFNAATAATPLPIGIIGFAVTGRNVVYPKGTVAMAKTSEPFVIAAEGGATQPSSAEISPGDRAGMQGRGNE